MNDDRLFIEPVIVVLQGVPVPKERPRGSSWAGKVRFYTPEKTRIAEQAFRLVAHGQMRRRKIFDCPIELIARFTFCPPASWSEQKRFAAIANEIPHVVKPDLDNLVKLVSDALIGIALRDDALVMRLSAEKRYGQASMTAVTIKPLTPEEL